MSKHFKISLGLILAGSGVFLALFLHLKQRLTEVRGVFNPTTRPSVNVLPKADKERIAFNEKTHTLTIQTTKGIIQEYSKSPIVEITKSGQVNIQRHLSGLENEPFIGFGYSDTKRLFLGDNVFHFSRFDLVGAISGTPDKRVIAFKPYVGMGYNFWHNTSLNIALNPAVVITRTPDIAGFVSVRF